MKATVIIVLILLALFLFFEEGDGLRMKFPSGVLTSDLNQKKIAQSRYLFKMMKPDKDEIEEEKTICENPESSDAIDNFHEAPGSRYDPEEKDLSDTDKLKRILGKDYNEEYMSVLKPKEDPKVYNTGLPKHNKGRSKMMQNLKRYIYSYLQIIFLDYIFIFLLAIMFCRLFI